MNELHRSKTQGNMSVIKNTIDAMLAIDDFQFEMYKELEKIDRCDELAECNTVGCMAGWCIVANRGIDDCFDEEMSPVCEDAAEMMGLRIGEAHDLFTPDEDDAMWNCRVTTSAKYISRQRAILALSYYYHEDEIEWDIMTLNRHARSIGLEIQIEAPQ